LNRFQVGLDEFNVFLTTGVSQEPLDADAIDRLRLNDLVLALACSRGNSEALVAFENLCGDEFQMAAAKLKLTNSQRYDLRQILWQHLFVGVSKRPKILEYRGHGPLRNWFRVTASRFLLNELRRTKRERLVLESDYGELRIASEIDPEFLLLEQIHRKQFRSALHAALKDLRPEQRNSLRCHYILGMTIDQMAEVLGIHRATAARRIGQARDMLLQFTREHLRQDLGADTDELDSVLRRAQGQSSLSVERLLNEAGLGDAENPL
jgi:RNA polymerase sigma-70 factor (ECF subfamily)